MSHAKNDTQNRKYWDENADFTFVLVALASKSNDKMAKFYNMISDSAFAYIDLFGFLHWSLWPSTKKLF